MRISLWAAVVGAIVLAALVPAAGADTKGPIDFEGYNPGPVLGQDSPPWTGAPCAAIDSGSAKHGRCLPSPKLHCAPRCSRRTDIHLRDATLH